MADSKQQARTFGRRRFLKVSATAVGGLAIGISLPPSRRFFVADASADDTQPNPMDVWLRIEPDESVTVMISNSEMGQGVYTSLAMLVAEELDVDFQNVTAEMAPAGPAYVNRMFGMHATGGSTSIRWANEPLRRVGATARHMLITAAANEWGVPAEECAANLGVIRHVASGRSTTYGAVAAAASLLDAPTDVVLKSPAEWRILGKSIDRLDTPMKVNGSARFGIDVDVPNMRVATVMACPVFGGKLASVDDAPAFAVQGVEQVLMLEDAVIVVADGYWPAKKGLAALQPQWSEGDNAGRANEDYRRELALALAEPGDVAHAAGNATDALANADTVIEAVYEVPHLAHATMEPMNATADVRADGATIWAPTQGPGVVQQVASGILGLPLEAITVHTTFLGGGFGRKFEMDFVVQAVLASKMSGHPVKLVWSREEDMRHDFYRPAAMSRFRIGVDGEGMPVAWENRIVCPSIMTRVFPQFVTDGIDPQSVEGAHELPYDIDHQNIEYKITETGVPVGFWRAVGNSQNAYFVQSMIDELAHAANKDPLVYQLELLGGQQRHKAVLLSAASNADWAQRSSQRPMGLAVHQSFGSYCAMVVELDADVDSGLRVKHVTASIDCGRALNPDTVVAQIESSIVYALTAAYYGDVTIENGAVVEGNFDTYPMLKLAQMPSVDVHIVESGEALGGIGEPGLPPLAPALVNAVYAATGTRVRRLPLAKAGFTIA